MSNALFPPPPEFEVGNDLNIGDLKWFLLTMMRIREFEERVGELVAQNKIVTPCHLCTGQEAVAAGVCRALARDDYVFGNHRSHGHYLAKGGDLRAAMAEVFGKSTGCSGGRGGSMHLTAPEVGILGTSSIVSGSIAIAVGSALAESIRGGKRVTAVFHGDSVPEEGIWHESANLAALKRLPVIFICEHNLYCAHMPLDRRRVRDNLSAVAGGHGLSSVTVDGNNVLAVYYAAQDAVKKAREGCGPVFIECRTYRWHGHVGPNDDADMGLRSRAEIDVWRERCPIKCFSGFLIETGLLSGQAVAEMRALAGAEVDEAVGFAAGSPYPDPQDLTKYVFKEGGQWL
ncbi:MAG: Acetoin:2,6-dichlorophenolindophenol oxidoreductase subunit alpha [Pelotomaculum sp. PtaU1.Bin065]|nr:MAG: Acetoin:2,6-dichlorophenolindophenol oxidoreductase subunit alpha [Pelotomaculum sp. PtaU1.Bin065]